MEDNSFLSNNFDLTYISTYIGQIIKIWTYFLEPNYGSDLKIAKLKIAHRKNDVYVV